MVAASLSRLDKKRKSEKENEKNPPFLFLPILKSKMINATTLFSPLTDFNNEGKGWIKCYVIQDHSSSIVQKAILHNAHCEKENIPDKLVLLSSNGIQNSPYFHECDPDDILSTSLGNLINKKFTCVLVPPFFAHDCLARINRLLELRASDLPLIVRFTALINYLFEVHSSTNKKFHQSRMNKSNAITTEGLRLCINKDMLFTPNSQTSQHEDLSARLMAETIKKIMNNGTCSVSARPPKPKR